MQANDSDYTITFSPKSIVVRPCLAWRISYLDCFMSHGINFSAQIALYDHAKAEQELWYWQQVVWLCDLLPCLCQNDRHVGDSALPTIVSLFSHPTFCLIFPLYKAPSDRTNTSVDYTADWGEPYFISPLDYADYTILYNYFSIVAWYTNIVNYTATELFFYSLRGYASTWDSLGTVSSGGGWVMRRKTGVGVGANYTSQEGSKGWLENGTEPICRCNLVVNPRRKLFHPPGSFVPASVAPSKSFVFIFWTSILFRPDFRLHSYVSYMNKWHVEVFVSNGLLWAIQVTPLPALVNRQEFNGLLTNHNQVWPGHLCFFEESSPLNSFTSNAPNIYSTTMDPRCTSSIPFQAQANHASRRMDSRRSWAES